MSLLSGMAAFRETKQHFSDGERQQRELILKSGETALVRIYGDFESDKDPVISRIHYVKRFPGGKQFCQCGENGEGHAGCVFCYVRSNGDQSIGGSMPRANFFVKDLRKYHRMDAATRVLSAAGVVKQRRNETLKDTDYFMTKYPNCAGPKPCQFCSQGNEPKVSGYRVFPLSTSYAEQLLNQQSQIRDFCQCGARTEEGQGTLYVAKYLCQHCKSDVAFDPSRGDCVAHCKKCGKHLPPLETIACSSCKNPVRCDIKDFIWKVSRGGEGKSTTYNFEPVHPCKPLSIEDAADAESNKPDWEKVLAPEPSEMQAASLGLPVSPFKTEGHGSVSFSDSAAEGGSLDDDFPLSEEEPVAVVPVPVPVTPVQEAFVSFGPDGLSATLPAKKKFSFPSKK